MVNGTGRGVMLSIAFRIGMTTFSSDTFFTLTRSPKLGIPKDFALYWGNSLTGLLQLASVVEFVLSFNGFMDYLWSHELNISNFGTTDRNILPMGAMICCVMSKLITKTSALSAMNLEMEMRGAGRWHGRDARGGAGCRRRRTGGGVSGWGFLGINGG
ncbi:hypothetical protein Tco_0347844 [Tanacetum coccineum]